MNQIKSCVFPSLSAEFIELLNSNDTLIIVGVIGKSTLENCNKMSCFDLFACPASLIDDGSDDRIEGRVKFYYEAGSKHIYVHFETTFDQMITYDLIANTDFDYFLPFSSQLRTRFARILLFATQICHIVILVETSSSFDASYLAIFKALKIIREKYVLRFLPKLLKNTTVGSYLGKEVRLCSPRFLFFFEKSGRLATDDLSAHEIEAEDSIYQMLRTNFIITNNSALSLFSIPKNKRFLYINDEKELNSDPLVDSLDLLLKYIDGPCDNELQIKPYRGYGIQYSQDTKTKNLGENKKRRFLNLIHEHVEEAIQHGFDDSLAKYRGKNHFVRPSIKTWFETFKCMHKIFIENPSNANFEAKDADYKAYLENFHKILDIDEQFFNDSCAHGYDLALMNYNDLLPHHYSQSFHASKLTASLEVFHKYARGTETQHLEEKLKDNCDSIWINGKKQCEFASLRGNPCIMVAKHATAEGSAHTSGVIYVSTCNCGKTQGRREDPYTIRKANYEFYQFMSNSCILCEKSTAIEFPVFVPSTAEFKAAEIINKNITSLGLPDLSNKTPTEEKTTDIHLSASQKTQQSETDLSLGSMSDEERIIKKDKTDSEEEINEIVVKIGEMHVREEQVEASSTVYLPGMLLDSSPPGLLPQFPSWSLLNIGPSSLYSHNTGLSESQQPGFLSGTNFLLPWDVKIRLEHAQNWAETYEKNRNRKKKQINSQGQGTYFTLKIFVGMEYECPRGHRFMMSSNDTILRGSAGGSVRACGSKIVFSDMPLFFPCPCRQNSIAQLMRVHVVTPKAPVNIIMEPKIRICRDSEMIFVTGWNEPAKLTQSAYFILRLPYVYQGEGQAIMTPNDVPASIDALRYGCLMEGMFGIKENETVEIESLLGEHR